MFTSTALKNQVAAKAYFDEHLSHNDYYTEGEIQPGYWVGQGAEHLGLKEGQVVDQSAFMSLCDGLHPATGEKLTLRHNAPGNRRVFFDFTCSAPKSVSVMAVTMDDPRLVEAHQESARAAIKELERFAAARVRVKGADADRTTGNVVGAEFLHNSSRALDPQLHTHFTLFNATFDAKENRWKALQTSDIFAASQYGTEVYRNELSRRLRAIGYEMEGIEIKGVSASLMKRFSKRSGERDAVIAQMEKRLGRKLSNNEVSWAVHQSRPRKLKGISTVEVRQMQLDQMTPEEISSLRRIEKHARGGALISKPVDESASLRYATAHVFERTSVVPETELLRHALIHGRGQTHLATLKNQIAGSEEFIRVGKEISTREILTTELFLIEKLNEGQNAFAALAPDFVPVNPSMGTDQRRAIAHILQSPDQFTGFRGLAGAGKTTALKELAEAFSKEDRSAVFCAPTAAATDVLRKDGFKEAVTLKALLVDPRQRQKLKPGAVIVLDEAGLVGLGDMKELFSLAVGAGARVVFSGDTGQHSGVARGDALRLLEEHSLYRFGQLDQIRRQQQADYRQTVELAANRRPQEAFDRLDARGCVEEPNRIYETAATAYLTAQANGNSALLVAPTWAEIDAVTECVRSRLKETGSLAKTEERVPVFDSLGWTEAQKGEFSHYRSGQQILFQQCTGAFRANEQVEIIAASDSGVRVRREDGNERLFHPRSGGMFDVGERREIAISPGDQLLLQANRKLSEIPNRSSGTLVNGQIVTVREIQAGRITLSDGRVLPPDYRQFAHGYCVTSHAAQARTVDSVFLVASSRSAPAIHREQFYVSISRGRKECRIFTDDKGILRDRITRSTHRRAALDLVKSALKEKGFATQPERKPVPTSGHPLRLRPIRSLPRTISPHRLMEISQRLFRQLVALSQKFRRRPEILPQETISSPAIRQNRL